MKGPGIPGAFPRAQNIKPPRQPADSITVTIRLLRARRRDRRQSDAGFTVIELMAALTILGLVSSAFAYGLNLSLAVTQTDRARVQASNLAAREIETVRNQFTASKTAPLTIAATSQVTNGNPLPGGTVGQPLNLDGTKYTVVRTVGWMPAESGTSPCDGGSAVTYPKLAVNVRVSWQQHGTTRDVESNTILTPPKGTLATVKGFIAAKVQGAAGTGVQNVAVDVTGPGGSQTRVTGEDGCAVFAMSTTGNYTVTLDEPGYVSFDGQPTTSKPAAVADNTIQVVPFSYDRAVTLQFEYEVTDEAGPSYAPVIPQPIVLFNPGLPNMGRKELDAGTTSVTSLWPFTDGYSVWAGKCTLNDPAATGGSRPQAVMAEPGETVTAPVPLKPVQVAFVDEDGNPIDHADARAEIDDATGCSATTYDLGKTDDQGLVRTALPYGRWQLRAGPVSYTVAVSSEPGIVYVPEGSGP